MAGLADRARQEGISTVVVDAVLGNVRQSERVLELDRSQPEFASTFAGYYPARVSDQRVKKGRALLRQHEQLLVSIQADTGVPPHYVLAFWGLETNYGSYLGDHNVPDALATLACDSRRGSYFSGELMQALRLIERGDVAAKDMRGSWAGAMGNVQFMPTNYVKHAVDADGDGRRDLWGSTADALASAGRFLKSLGWKPGLRWGREVFLPEDFDLSLIGQKQPLRFWAARDVRNAAGAVLPALDETARILLPSGHRGPAFIAYDNFDVIMGWNRSEHYALTVGRLADRIAGGGRLARAIPQGPKRFSLDAVRLMQEQLTSLGYDLGEPDGRFGPATRKALAQFQADTALRADGYPSSETQEALSRRAGQG